MQIRLHKGPLDGTVVEVEWGAFEFVFELTRDNAPAPFRAWKGRLLDYEPEPGMLTALYRRRLPNFPVATFVDCEGPLPPLPDIDWWYEGWRDE
jgi:hypothetical protein